MRQAYLQVPLQTFLRSPHGRTALVRVDPEEDPDRSRPRWALNKETLFKNKSINKNNLFRQSKDTSPKNGKMLSVGMRLAKRFVFLIVFALSVSAENR